MLAALGDVLLTALPSALAAAVILVACAVVGWGALPRRWRPGHGRLAVPLAISSGATILGLAVWLAGTAVSSRLAPWVVLVLAAAAAGRGRGLTRAAARWASELAALARASWPATLLLGVVVLVAATNLVLPLVDSDGLRYHVALPKLFLLEGRVRVVADDLAGSFPQSAEMLTMAALTVSSGEAAKFIHFGFFLLTLAVLATVVHRHRRLRPAAALSAVLFATSPVALIAATYAFIDHVALFHLAVACLLGSRRTPAPAAVGLALAGAATTKYTTAPGIAAVLVAMVLRAPRGRRGVTAAGLVLPAAVAFMPFAARNLVTTGDPFFPLGTRLLGRAIPGVTTAAYEWATQFHGAVPGLLGVTWFEAQGPTHPDEIAGAHLLAGFIAVALALRQRWAWSLIALVFAHAAVGLGYHPPTRYLLPMLWALAGLTAVILCDRWRRWGTAVGLLLLAPAAVLSSRLLVTGFRPFDLLGGELGRDVYLSQQVPAVEAAWVVNAGKAGGGVMAPDFPAPYYFDRPWVVEGVHFRPPLARWLAEADSADALLARFRERGLVTLVVPPRYGGGTRATLLPLADTPRGQALVLELRRRLLLIKTVNGFDVYRLPPAP